MQDSILIVDCKNVHHVVKIDNIKDFGTYQPFKNASITTVYLKELANNLLDIKTYESEDSIRLRYSKIYDGLYKED